MGARGRLPQQEAESITPPSAPRPLLDPESGPGYVSGRIEDQRQGSATPGQAPAPGGGERRCAARRTRQAGTRCCEVPVPEPGRDSGMYVSAAEVARMESLYGKPVEEL